MPDTETRKDYFLCKIGLICEGYSAQEIIDDIRRAFSDFQPCKELMDIRVKASSDCKRYEALFNNMYLGVCLAPETIWDRSKEKAASGAGTSGAAQREEKTAFPLPSEHTTETEENQV